MRLVRYGGAMSLDGYIAGPNGEYDWIVHDPDMNFAEMTEAFDTYLIGRKTFEVMLRAGGAKPPRGIRYIVCSGTLNPDSYPGALITNDAVTTVSDLKAKTGKDIALFGGGELFRSLLAAGLVDSIEVSVIPILLGTGIPLLASPANRAKLTLRAHTHYPKTGIVRLAYDIVRPGRTPPRRTASRRTAD